MFAGLTPEDKDARKKDLNERLDKYKEDIVEFEKSVAGKRYRMMTQSFEKRKRINTLKMIMMRKEPKKPPTAFSIFSVEKRAEVIKDFPDLKGADIQTKLDEMWKELSEDDRETFESKEKEGQARYEKAKEAFESSLVVKNYQMALKGGGASATLVPEPSRPDNYP